MILGNASERGFRGLIHQLLQMPGIGTLELPLEGSTV